MAAKDSEHRRQVATIGAHALHASHDSRELTAPGRAAFDRRFDLEVDPDGTLSPEERARRADHARKAYFAKLALKSEARRKRKSARSKRGLRRERPTCRRTAPEGGPCDSGHGWQRRCSP